MQPCGGFLVGLRVEGCNEEPLGPKSAYIARAFRPTGLVLSGKHSSGVVHTSSPFQGHVSSTQSRHKGGTLPALTNAILRSISDPRAASLEYSRKPIRLFAGCRLLEV